MSGSRIRLLLVSGLSGAGKSSALKILEDLGYEAVDNLPLALLSGLAPPEPANDAAASPHAIAVGIDSRTRGFDAERLVATLGDFRARGDVDARLLFLECDDAELLHRFTATRRRHPLASDRPVADGIAHERQLMAKLRDAADQVIDTTDVSLPELRHVLSERCALDAEHGLNITVASFSYRRGLPREADLVFDVRFLKNPYYVANLTDLTGDRPEVGAYIASDAAFTPFFQGLSEMLLTLLPHYSREGKSYLTIAIGCTGGRHRSVYVAEKLARLLRDEGYRVSLRHRDLEGQAG
ncbi:MAG TPA: RNase adapter RapZ [Candidatus Cybelea sp.]|nr:RNase adapter RapZ [Candidatus Cybelea sp.]